VRERLSNDYLRHLASIWPAESGEQSAAAVVTLFPAWKQTVTVWRDADLQTSRNSSARVDTEVLRSHRPLHDNLVLAFDKTTGVLVRCDVPESDIVCQGAKQRNPAANEHGYARDREALNEPSLKKTLDGDPAIYVRMPESALIELRDDLLRRA
jgi:hypothetical protein